MSRAAYSRALGFTLLEVLAALAVAAVGILAVSRTLSSSITVADGVEARTVAYWVAGNEMSELRISRLWPSVGETRRPVAMGARRWVALRRVVETPDADVLRVEVEVRAEGDDATVLATVNGYVARIMPPREPADG